jgi:small subunit ribosomal protein S12
MMVRILQKLKTQYVDPSSKNQEKAKPQSKAICIQLTTISPKKPNSANRRIAKASFKRNSSKKNLSVKIQGEGHNLQQHSTILVRAGKVRDLIGVNHIAIRGKLDLLGVSNRKTSRSVYGIKRS